MVNPPYSLCDFTLNDLKELQKYNTKLNKSFPLPPSATTKANHISSSHLIKATTIPWKSPIRLGIWMHGLIVLTPLLFTHTASKLHIANIYSKSMIGQSAFTLIDSKTLGMMLIRRPPDIYHYIPEDCPFLMKVPAEDCTSGKNCTYCHSTVERLYHPTKYKTLACEVHS